MSPPIIYAVVVTHNGSPWIEKCVSSLISSELAVKVIVVDNASTDNTRLVVDQFSEVECLELDKNVGFGRANNVGISEALRRGADYVFLLNQDASVRADTIHTLVSIAEVNPDFGILSPLHLNGDGTRLDPHFMEYVLYGASGFYSDLYFRRLRHVYPIHFINAAAWLVTRKCLECVGGFDPLFFMYGEDDDFCKRAIFQGFKIGVVASAAVLHAREKNSNLSAGRWQNLQARADRLMSAMLIDLKDPFKSLLKQFLIVCANIAHQGSLFLLQGDRQGAAALVLATIKIVIRLAQVPEHRRICRTPGAHWISWTKLSA